MPEPRRVPAVRCTAMTAIGTPCKAWAVRGSDPPRCAAHGGGQAAPPPDKVGEAGSLSLDAAIADLYRRLGQLSAYIDDRLADLEPGLYARLASLQGQLTSRLGRLLRDRQQLQGDAADQLIQAVHQALDDISTEWGVEL
jgi:hypothetical protein